MTFDGFPEEALEFYEGLEADNTKAYWTDHKSVYDNAVVAPMKALLDSLSEWGEAKMFRPYRDVRFSKDKTPYKTRQYAVIEGPTALYVGIDAHGLHLGGGVFHTTTEQVARLREAVAGQRGAALVKALDALRAAGFEVGGDQLKRVPKPYEPDHARAELLKHKTLISWVDHAPAEWLHTPAARDRVVEAWTAVGPLRSWLEKNVVS